MNTQIKLNTLFGFALLIAAGFSAMSVAGEIQQVKNAVKGFYSATNSGDFEKLNNYLLPDGFTEYAIAGGRRIHISVEALRKLFAGNLKIAVKVENLDVELLGGAALATYYRIGTIDRSGKAENLQPQTLRVSSVWHKVDGRWYLVHIHNSELIYDGKGIY